MRVVWCSFMQLHLINHLFYIHMYLICLLFDNYVIFHVQVYFCFHCATLNFSFVFCTSHLLTDSLINFNQTCTSITPIYCILYLLNIFSLKRTLSYINILERNQARTGQTPVHAWFLKIDIVWTSICVYLCVSAPRAIKNYSCEMKSE